MTKRVCQRATSPSLPCVMLHDILAMVKDGRDVVAFLAALPPSTLSPELVALRHLGAAVDLADHWPVVHITTMPIEHARLGIAALPAFAGIYIDAGFTSLAWLDAKLPPTMPLTLVVDPSVLGVQSVFAYVWGDRVTSVIVKVQPDLIPHLLGRCVNVQTVTIQDATSSDTAAYMAALPKQHLYTLTVTSIDEEILDTSGIVAWLQGASATTLTLDCDMYDPMALASAILACATLRSLSLTCVPSIEDNLVTLPGSLHHVTSLSVSDSNLGAADALRLVRKLDRTKVLSFTFGYYISRPDDDDEPLEPDSMLDTLAKCPALQTLRLDRVNIDGLSPITTTDGWPQLSTFAMRSSTFKTPSKVVELMQQLSTSRCLATVDLSHSKIGAAGFVALAKALPAWMARGLQTLTLRATGLRDDDVEPLAVALASRKSRRLTVDLDLNPLATASMKLLLGALSACRNVTLHVDTTGFTNSLSSLVQLHKLVQVAPGVLMAPPQTSSATQFI